MDTDAEVEPSEDTKKEPSRVKTSIIYYNGLRFLIEI